MVFSGINYRETYFEFPELTKVRGEPTSESLFKLRNELKANAKSVYSNLSDGDHGHLALVLSDAQYALLTAVPFIRPIFPGALVVPPLTTGPMATVLKEAHQENIRLFREVQGVEKALIQQIVQAVEAPYLSSIRDRDSNSLRGTVYEILTYLQEVYGRVSPQMLEDRDNDLRSMVYNPQQPIDVVFNAVEDYVDFADLGHQALSPQQTIGKAYVIINKTRRFKNDITAWNRLPEMQKTWPSFKDHFRRAHREFRESTDITLEDSDLARNNANLVQQVVTGMQAAMAADSNPADDTNGMLLRASEAKMHEMQESMNLLQAQIANQRPAPYYPYNSYPTPSYPPPNNGGYHQGFQGNQQQQHGQQQQNPNYQGQYYNPNYQQGQQRQQPNYHSNNNQGYQGGYQGRGTQGRGFQGRGRGNNDGRGGGAPARQRNFSIYCWTHGGSGHSGANCIHKLNGHQDNATFQNKMGGSTKNCQP
jgi:hypothetical protein